MHADFEAWCSRLRGFRYIPVLSRADAAWTGRRGYVQRAVAEDFRDLSKHAIYLCGSPNMIAEARKEFIQQGASMEHVYADGFHFQLQEEVL